MSVYAFCSQEGCTRVAAKLWERYDPFDSVFTCAAHQPHPARGKWARVFDLDRDGRPPAASWTGRDVADSVVTASPLVLEVSIPLAKYLSLVEKFVELSERYVERVQRDMRDREGAK